MALNMRIRYAARTLLTYLESSCTSRHNDLMHGLNRTKVATLRQFSSSTSFDQYVVKVAVVGDPNVGKSTLINQILDRRVNSVSKKVHTTRRKSRAVLNTDNTQIIFVDTPGFVSRHSKAKRMLEKSVLADAYTSVKEVDVVVMVHDSSNFYWKYKHSGEAKKALEMVPAGVKAVLALNKVDLIKDKTELLNMSRILTQAPAVQKDGRKKKSMEDIFDQYENDRQINSCAMPQGSISSKITKKDNQRKPEFDAVFMLSAKDGTGVEALKNYLLNKAQPSDWEYGGGFYTDQSMNEMITMCVREKMLDRLPDEVPYMIQPEVVHMEEDDSGILYIQVALRCQSNRQKSILRGVDDKMLTNIQIAAENSLSEAFGKTVILNTDVKETPEFRQRITKRLKRQS